MFTKISKTYFTTGELMSESHSLYDMGGTCVARHRVDCPAMIGYNIDGSIKYEDYYQNDLLHRLDGPAKCDYVENPGKEYWINGKQIICNSDEEFKRIVKLMMFK